MATATNEPFRIFSGSSASWKLSLTDYSASEYYLRYVLNRLNGEGDPITFESTASGTAHLVELSPSTTENWTPGEYRFNVFALDTATEGATTKTQVGSGNITIDADPESGSAGDPRTTAEIILEQLEATYKRLSNDSVITASAAGKSYTKRSLPELRREIAEWRNVVNQERAAREAKSGNKSAGRVLFRFNQQV